MAKQKPTTEEIEKALFNHGKSLEGYFIIAGTPLYWPNKESIPTLCFFDGVELGTACTEYLCSHGANPGLSLA